MCALLEARLVGHRFAVLPSRQPSACCRYIALHRPCVEPALWLSHMQPTLMPAEGGGC